MTYKINKLLIIVLAMILSFRDLDAEADEFPTKRSVRNPQWGAIL